jgi:hypothetical protein
VSGVRAGPIGILVAAAVAAGAGCGGAPQEPPALPEQIGVVREFGGEYRAGDAARPVRYWILEEQGGGRRSRVAGGPGEFREASSRLSPSGGQLVYSTQWLRVTAGEPTAVILTSPPGPVPLSTSATAFSVEFYRELVRVGEALEVDGSARGGCTDYAAPLVTHSLGLVDSVAAREQATVSTTDGSPSAVTIRLCGPERELSRVSAPAHRLTLAGGESVSRPAEDWRLDLVRRRPATERLVADTFDLTRVHPGARAESGSVVTTVP